MFLIKNQFASESDKKGDLPQKVKNKGLLKNVKPVWVP